MVLINAGRKNSTAKASCFGWRQHHPHPDHRRRRGSGGADCNYCYYYYNYHREILVVLTLGGIAVCYIIFAFSTMGQPKQYNNNYGSSTAQTISRRDQQQQPGAASGAASDGWDADFPVLKLADPEQGENTDFFDATAADILHVLQCHTLLASHSPWDRKKGAAVNNIRPATPNMKKGNTRNEANMDGDDENGLADAAANEVTSGDAATETEGDEMGNDDEVLDATTGLVTGAHLFCLAALPQLDGRNGDETAFWNDKVRCNVRGDKQATILDLWSTARAEISDEEILQKTLRVATEQSVILLGKELFVWAALNDHGTTYMINSINEQARNQSQKKYGGVAGLSDNLGLGKLYVDVGSGLGYNAMTVALLYPDTEIVSIEAAPPNWLLQEMNWRCNDFPSVGHKKRAQVLLAGVGPSTGTSQLANFLWRPTATTNTRAWSLSPEEQAKAGLSQSRDDLEVSVKLRPWHAIQLEANIQGREIDVLNLDCEGCEYNLVPALTATEFDSMSTIMGQVHWAYIPRLTLPSSKRGKDTHERLCQHENFVRSSIECCAFPNVKVRSSFSGELLVVDSTRFPPQRVTVKDLTGKMCDSFEAWAVEHNLNNVKSDWGWFLVRSMQKLSQS